MRRAMAVAAVVVAFAAVPACDDGTGTVTLGGVSTGTTTTGATLNSLAISSGTLSPAFSAATLTYSASVSNATSTLTVTPAVPLGASVTVDGETVTGGTPSGAIDLGIGANAITVTVTAADGVTTQTYTINVTRAAS